MVLAKVRALTHRIIAMVGGQALLQRLSEAFWARSRDTYVASPAYYDHRERALRDLLAGMSAPTHALDQGCGDGRFTLVMVDYCGTVDAFDLSPALIEKASRMVIEQNRTNVRFAVREMERADIRSSPYDLVACMGVTTCVVDDVKFARVLDQLRDATAQGGHLLLIDTLSDDTSDRIVSHRFGYVAKYRSLRAYIEQVESRGFVKCQEIFLTAWSEKLINKLFLFKRTSQVQ